MKRTLNLLAISLVVVSTTGYGAEETPHWTYEGEAGPANWAAISPAFAACGGKNQSPINLTGFIEAELPPISFNYQPGGTEAINNGHTAQVNFAAGSSIGIDGATFALKQFHFHSPSENQVNGKSYAAEMHLVHADEGGNLAVVAVMIDPGAANAALAPIVAALPASAGSKAALESPADTDKLLPPNRDYYRFNGSLTTPPCSEGVRWLVMKNPITASAEQLQRLGTALGRANNRPVQSINARPVLQ